MNTGFQSPNDALSFSRPGTRGAWCVQGLAGLQLLGCYGRAAAAVLEVEVGQSTSNSCHGITPNHTQNLYPPDLPRPGPLWVVPPGTPAPWAACGCHPAWWDPLVWTQTMSCSWWTTCGGLLMCWSASRMLSSSKVGLERTGDVKVWYERS